jgi:hypothetical protein
LLNRKVIANLRATSHIQNRSRVYDTYDVSGHLGEIEKMNQVSQITMVGYFLKKMKHHKNKNQKINLK